MKRHFLLFFTFMIIAGAWSGCSALDENSDVLTPGAIVSGSLDTISDHARTYDVVETITFSNEGDNQPEKFNLWVALMSTIPPYQEVHSLTISPSQFILVSDEYGNQYAEFDLFDIQPGKTSTITIRYTITINSLEINLSSCNGELIQEFIQPELHIEANNPQILSLAENLSNPAETVCEQVHSFYNYIGDNLIYTFNDHDWGAQATFGEMGADCTEYTSLMIALSRSQKIPARYLEGILYLENDRDNDGLQEHAWLEVYLPGIGWAPMDPTFGRSPLTRSEYFGKVPADRFIVTRGRNPSTLRGGSYYTYIYWPGNATSIKLIDQGWQITPVNP
ncbi:MAG: transglutaminase-like domain-containing protein [Desulfobulbaceae bacterium]|nr:transglutaminase-like domain-containing protein [Desulfobulbaceae bacterium]